MRYFIIWVEGLSARSGEKVLSIGENGCEYTAYMTKALRVKSNQRSLVREKLIELGVVESFITFVPTSYVPSGTLFDAEESLGGCTDFRPEELTDIIDNHIDYDLAQEVVKAYDILDKLNDKLKTL